jgi:Flp pilus assembly protein TadG
MLMTHTSHKIRMATATKVSQPFVPGPQLGFGRIAEFAEDTSGDVVVLFGLMFAVSMMVIGAAVDFGRWTNARSETAAAVDAAVLAGGRALQTNGGNEADAIAVATRYYAQAAANRIPVTRDSVKFKVTDNGTSIIATGNARIATPFMSLAGVSDLPLLKDSGAGSSAASLGVGSQSGVNLEIAMMLDTSGSMAQSTSSGNAKIADLKQAAQDLVKIVVWDDQSSFKSRVSLVPFSADVRIPGGWLSNVQDPSWPSTRTLGNGNANGNGHGNDGEGGQVFKKTVCVGERTGGDKHTDAAAGTGRYIMNAYTPDGQCGQKSSDDEVVPMTSDKNKLLQKLEKLSIGGGTAGHIGTAWAYYMLSPKWANVVPHESAAVSFGTPKTEKIAILMTDGEYNFTYDNDGIPTNYSHGNANGNSSAGQAIAICNQMKQSGIKVYTVGFDLGGNQTAINTLQTCATDPSKFYNAKDGAQLKLAFRDIALKVSQLHLTR